MSKKKMLSFTQFIKRFPNEKACVDYLYKVKWPKGFVCPVCGCRHDGSVLRCDELSAGDAVHQCGAVRDGMRTVLPAGHCGQLSAFGVLWAVFRAEIHVFQVCGCTCAPQNKTINGGLR